MRRRQLAKFVPILLTFIGSLALAAGLFVAVITMTRTPADHHGINLPLQGAIYVGADTCFTCHKDQTHDWSLELKAQPATLPVANPQITVVDERSSEQDPHGEMGGTTSINVLADQAAQPSQHYVIATENDPALLPGQWTPELNPPVGCADCHTLSSAAQKSPIKTVELNCERCHSQQENAMNRVWSAPAPLQGINREQYG